MTGESSLIKGSSDLVESVKRFMQTPDYWRAAVGNHPKYFVHFQKGRQHFFGLSKFCAFKNISLEDYVDREVRFERDGSQNRRHIREVTGQQWIPLAKEDSTIQNEFENWFSQFFPTYDLKHISIISLGKI